MEDAQMEYGMARVIECFPAHAALIRDRFHADETFREICGDFIETLEALKRWQASSSPHKTARIEEYRELAAALQVEIATALRVPGQEMRDRLT